MERIIELKDISLKYGEKIILDRINLSVERGDKILIKGKSGAGKSSLLKILMGFRNFDNGFVLFENQLLTSTDFAEYRNRYAYVNQDVTIRKGSIKEFLKVLHNYKNNAFELSGKDYLEPSLMEYFDFDEQLLMKNSEDLSGGERQRLGIIIAIMLKRPIYLLDEVTSGLDKGLKIKVVDYFSSCQETVISISHDEVWEETKRFKKVVW